MTSKTGTWPPSLSTHGGARTPGQDGSGAIGRVLLRSPAKPPHAENVVMETTYGDRLHKQLGLSIDEFYEAITETFERGETSSSLPSLWSAHRSCSII